MNKRLFDKDYLLDTIFLIFLFLISYTLISVYVKGNYIDISYWDWMMQAFRVKSLSTDGYTSWTHVWSNGMNFWRTYQFIPHYITLFISRIYNLPIPRTMVILTIVQFILLRIFIYVALRLLRFNPVVSLVCALLSVDLSQYWEGVSDYSQLFGFTLFPVMLFLWIKYTQGKIQYIFPYIIGICFYIHILLGFIITALWITSTIFSNQKILSKKSLIQFGTFLVSSSIFWYPLIFKSSYTYINDFTSNRAFFNLVFRLFGGNFGLSTYIILCFIISCFYIFTPIQKLYSWSKILFIFVLFYFIAILIGLNVDLPKVIDQTQYVRGVTMLGIAILFVFAACLQKLFSLKHEYFFWGIILLCSLSLIDSIFIIGTNAPLATNSLEDPVRVFTNTNKNIDLTTGRIWTPTLTISNYFNSNSYRYSDDDMSQQEQNQVAMRLDGLISYPPLTNTVEQPTIDRLNDYLVITGTKYLFLSNSSPYAKALIENGDNRYILLGSINLPHSLYEALQTPWKPLDAVLIQNKYTKNLEHFPYALVLSQNNDNTLLDSYVHKFATTISQSDNIALPISYPTQESIEVAVPQKPTSHLVYIDESYDTNWKAEINGRNVPIRPVGPNFMLATLPTLTGGTLLLEHSFPLSFYISIYLILLIPILFIVNIILQKYFLRNETM